MWVIYRAYISIRHQICGRLENRIFFNHQINAGCELVEWAVNVYHATYVKYVRCVGIKLLLIVIFFRILRSIFTNILENFRSCKV